VVNTDFEADAGGDAVESPTSENWTLSTIYHGIDLLYCHWWTHTSMSLRGMEIGGVDEEPLPGPIRQVLASQTRHSRSLAAHERPNGLGQMQMFRQPWLRLSSSDRNR
jgi:hypothetical protein